VMVVEHAERFGLSQLHQLRGRVGRGPAGGQCLLVNRGTANAVAAERLRTMEKEHDGFKIAEADLRLRGPGELLGARQSGLADFRFANLARDSRLLAEARREAFAWLENDPQLRSKASAGMSEILHRRWAGGMTAIPMMTCQYFQRSLPFRDKVGECCSMKKDLRMSPGSYSWFCIGSARRFA